MLLLDLSNLISDVLFCFSVNDLRAHFIFSTQLIVPYDIHLVFRFFFPESKNKEDGKYHQRALVQYRHPSVS